MTSPFLGSNRTVVVRLPDDLAASIKLHARLNGVTPAEMARRAWDAWWARNGDQIIDDGHAQLEAMRPVAAPTDTTEENDG